MYRALDDLSTRDIAEIIGEFVSDCVAEEAQLMIKQAMNEFSEEADKITVIASASLAYAYRALIAIHDHLCKHPELESEVSMDFIIGNMQEVLEDIRKLAFQPKNEPFH